MSELPLAWFAMRSTGLVAAALLTVAVVLGIIGPCLRPTPRLTAIGVHRASSLAAVMLLAAHVVLAVLDRWIALDWWAAFLPGVAQWQRWGTALGALGVDLVIAIMLTSAVRLHGPRVWRGVHLVAVPAWVLALCHGLVVGSDAAGMRALALGCGGTVLLALAGRILCRAGSARAATAAPVSVGVPR